MSFDIYDENFKQILLPESKLSCLTSPAIWAEGPVWLPQEDALIFSDVKACCMYQWHRNGTTQIFRAASNFANGNTLDRQGNLLTCEHGRRGISRTNKDKTNQLLIDKFDGKRFNSPNDLVVKSDGTIWFTDPPYGIIGDLEGYQSASQIIGCYVYRFDPKTGQIDAVATDVQRPNGLCFSPDESKLYVADMSIVEFPTKGRSHLAVYDVVEGVRLTNPRVFAQVSPGVPDGFRVDIDGRVFCSCEDGILVFDALGKKLGKIKVPERVSNCTFGGFNEDELFITASTSLYHIQLATKGVQYSHFLK